METTAILAKINELTIKWKDNKPEKNTLEYWRYRADQSYYLMLKNKLNSAKKLETPGIYEKGLEIFNGR